MYTFTINVPNFTNPIVWLYLYCILAYIFELVSFRIAFKRLKKEKPSMMHNSMLVLGLIFWSIAPVWFTLTVLWSLLVFPLKLVVWIVLGQKLDVKPVVVSYEFIKA